MLILHRKISSVSKAGSIRELVLISESDSKTFDNSPLTCHDVIIDGDGLAEGDTISYSFTGSQKWIGSSENTFTYSINNVSGTNYIVTCEYGELAVTDDDVDDALIVEMTAEGQEGSEDEIQYRLDDTVTFEISVRNPYADAQTITLSEIEDVTLAQNTFENVTGGQSVSTTATYTVKESDILRGSFTNTVTANIENLTKTVECTILTEEPNPHISISFEILNEEDYPDGYNVGDYADVRITVGNDGNVSFEENDNNYTGDIIVSSEPSGDEWGINANEFHPGEGSRAFEARYTPNGWYGEDIPLNGGAPLTVVVTAMFDGTEYTFTETLEPENFVLVEPSVNIVTAFRNVSSPNNGTNYVLHEYVEYDAVIGNIGNINVQLISSEDIGFGNGDYNILLNNIDSINDGYDGQTFRDVYYEITQQDISNGYFRLSFDLTTNDAINGEVTERYYSPAYNLDGTLVQP